MEYEKVNVFSFFFFFFFFFFFLRWMKNEFSLHLSLILKYFS